MDKGLLIQSTTKFLLGIVVLGVLLFLPAGSFRYWQGWLQMGFLFVPMLIVGLVMMAKNPELLRKRLNAKEKETEQKTVVARSGLFFIVVFVVAGARYLDYTGKIVNVPVTIDGKPLSLNDSYKLFGRPVLGGFNRKTEIGKASPEKIAGMTRQIIANGSNGHLMIGANCSVPSPLDITANIHAAVITAHGRKQATHILTDDV